MIIKFPALEIFSQRIHSGALTPREFLISLAISAAIGLATFYLLKPKGPK